MNRTCFFLVFVSLMFFAQRGATAHDVASAMADAASDFLTSLEGEQRSQATYDFADPERKDWHFVPRPFTGPKKRGGLPSKDMRPDQRHLAYALLSTGLSHRGYTTALQIMSLEHVLWEIEQAPHRDSSMYYLTIFGEPGADRWGWRFEGHHLSANFTIAGGEVVAGTPVFFASNPAEVRDGPRRGLRVLPREEDVARALVTSLDEGQKKDAVIGDRAPQDILTSAEQKVDPLEGEGIPFSRLGGAQRELLEELVGVYLHRLRAEVAAAEWQEIREAGMDGILFAWAGGFEKGEPHYYRVQGPTFLLEYANTQNGANHVHAVWRDFDGDFGEDVLRRHYALHHREERPQP